MDIELEYIFIDCQKELSSMKFIKIKALKSIEHKTYVIFNSQGVGKTSLIKKIGEIIENEDIIIDDK